QACCRSTLVLYCVTSGRCVHQWCACVCQLTNSYVLRAPGHTTARVPHGWDGSTAVPRGICSERSIRSRWAVLPAHSMGVVCVEAFSRHKSNQYGYVKAEMCTRKSRVWRSTNSKSMEGDSVALRCIGSILYKTTTEVTRVQQRLRLKTGFGLEQAN
ncbi:unnamed protein product, partial [Ectocarpus sp. 12 AP-2014]